MIGTEQVYALYVQANPVPNPDAMAITHAGAQLLDFERSTEVETLERSQARPMQPGRQRRAFALGLGTVLVVAAAAAAIVLFITGGDDEPVAAADAFPEVVFDGDGCRWYGPTRIEAGLLEMTAVNTSGTAFTAGAWAMIEPRLSTELERNPLGTDLALEPTSPTPDGRLVMGVEVDAGSRTAASVFMGAGTYLIDCVTFAGDDPNHVWRADTLVEVVAP